MGNNKEKNNITENYNDEKVDKDASDSDTDGIEYNHEKNENNHIDGDDENENDDDDEEEEEDDEDDEEEEEEEEEEDDDDNDACDDDEEDDDNGKFDKREDDSVKFDKGNNNNNNSDIRTEDIEKVKQNSYITGSLFEYTNNDDVVTHTSLKKIENHKQKMLLLSC